MMDGGAGNDTIVGGLGNDTLTGGGQSNDTLSYASDTSGGVSVWLGDGGATVTLAAPAQDIDGDFFTLGGGEAEGDVIAGFANLIGGSGFDTLVGSNANNILTGGDSGDNLYGRGGNDTIFGEAGNDTIEGGDGNDTLNGGADNDNISGGANNDKIDGGDGDDILSGGDGADTFNGGKGVDLVSYQGVQVALSVTLGTFNTVTLDTASSTVTGAGVSETILNVEGFRGGGKRHDRRQRRGQHVQRRRGR